MPSATDHCRTLLAAIIPDGLDNLTHAQRHLNASHFPDLTLRNLWQMLERYADVAGDVITRSALVDLLTRARTDAGTILLYQETYDYLAQLQVDEPSFKWSLEQIRELAAERATMASFTTGMEILTRGIEERGKHLRGHVDARRYMLSRFAEIDRDLAMQESPEGNMRGEGSEILADYLAAQAAREKGRGTGILFGIPALDARVGGLQRGELVLLVGYTGDGKTSCSVQLAWSAAVEQKKNVVILTTETIRAQVRRRIISRHSCHPAFGIEGGLNSRDIRDGTLSPEHVAKLKEIVDDFDNNPGYGNCYIVQVPRGASMGYCESKLTRIGRDFEVDLGIMDYFALLKPDRKLQSTREDLATILKEGKQLCTSIFDGKGIPFLSPWQVTRSARMEAENAGAYSSSAVTSETAEASNTPDLLISLLAPMDVSSRYAKLKMQILKARDGAKANAFEVMADYATSCFGVSGRQETMDDIFGNGNPLL